MTSQILNKKIDAAIKILKMQNKHPIIGDIEFDIQRIQLQEKRPFFRLAFYCLRTRGRTDMTGWVDAKRRVNLWKPFVVKADAWTIAHVLSHEFAHVWQWKERGFFWIVFHLLESEREADKIAR